MIKARFWLLRELFLILFLNIFVMFSNIQELNQTLTLILENQLFEYFFIFFIGFLGILYNRNNLLVVLMGIEVSLLGLNLNFLTLSYLLDDFQGEILALFILVIAAAEAAVGLAILIAFFKTHSDLQVNSKTSLIRN